MTFVRKQWFLLGLFLAITAGLGIGGAGASLAAGLQQTVDSGMRWIVAVVLGLMSFTLRGDKLRAALRSPRAVLLACVCNSLLVPLLAWPLLPLQQASDFRLGLMIAASVPCTIAAASLWTRSAGGNDAVPLLTTLITNGLCFVVTPAWLRLAVAGPVILDTQRMTIDLILTALIPISLGQLLRLQPGWRDFADRWKTVLGIIAQSGILLTVFWTTLKSGPKLRAGADQFSGLSFLTVWACCLGLHAVVTEFSLWMGGRLGLSTADRIGATFAAAQKTLPIGVYVASRFPDSPFAVVPMVLYHATQLIYDSVAVARLNRMLPASSEIVEAQSPKSSTRPMPTETATPQ